MLGDELKARESANEVLRIKPTYSMAMVMGLVETIERKERILKAYRKAGIPE